jgi:hypothetical protein
MNSLLCSRHPFFGLNNAYSFKSRPAAVASSTTMWSAVGTRKAKCKVMFVKLGVLQKRSESGDVAQACPYSN